MIYLQCEQQRSRILQRGSLWKVFLTHIYHTVYCTFEQCLAEGPRGDPACAAFISWQMLVLIILSFPVVPPPRLCRPPPLLPLAPRLIPGGGDSLPPSLTPPYPPAPAALRRLSFQHCFLISLLHLLGSTPSLSLLSLRWLAHLGEVKGVETSALWSLTPRCFIKPTRERVFSSLLTGCRKIH